MSLTYDELWNEISSGQVISVDSDLNDEFIQPDSPKNDTDSEDYEDSSSNEEDSYFVIDSDPIERYADIILDRGEVANALESVFHEALAHFNKSDFTESQKKSHKRDENETFVNEIDNFWEGWVEGLNETTPKIENKSPRMKDHKKISKSSRSSADSDDIVDIFAFDSFASSEIEFDLDNESYFAPLLPVPTVKPTDLQSLPIIAIKEEVVMVKPETVAPPPQPSPVVVVEVYEEQKETKVKRKPAQRKSSPKNKKRKSTSSESEVEHSREREELSTKKTKTKKAQNKHFKREEVLKIENDGEDEDIDIGDLNDCQ